MRNKKLVLFTVLIVLSLLATPVLAQGVTQATPKPNRTYLPMIVGSAVAEADPTAFSDAAAGETFTIHKKIPLNLVFIGYEPGKIDDEAILEMMPGTYAPVVRYPQFYGISGRDLGLKYHFNYRVWFPGQEFEDEFFTFLADAGEENDLTVYQQAYNDQENNLLDVPEEVLYIDGPSVENWLAEKSRALYPKFDRSYTIFFINWYGRDDFQFHVYSNLNTPDPDTGAYFGARSSRKTIAWGGTTSRSWFYDLSAGPEAWTDNWNVDNPDLDGDGVVEYRMPPIWEYDEDGYRDPDALSNDLGLIARFVGINLLFTTSPLYDPAVANPAVGGKKVANLNMFEDEPDPDDNGIDWISESFIFEKLSKFQPYYDWAVKLFNNDPIDADTQRAYRIWAGLLEEDDCWNPYGTPFAELFCYFTANEDLFVPPYGAKDYVAKVYNLNTTDENMGSQLGLLGYADDNWVDGTQSLVFGFGTPYYRDLGYGFSTTNVHEMGHHIGMSHPHDGYDSEYDIDFGPGGDLYFVWSGDESHTIMHYMDLTDEFGQFDQDNMYRLETAFYAIQANVLLGDILDGATPAELLTVAPLLAKAKTNTVQAATAFFRWEYKAAVTHIYTAYSILVTVAEKLGIPVPQQVEQQQLPINQNVPHEGDPIRFPND